MLQGWPVSLGFRSAGQSSALPQLQVIRHVAQLVGLQLLTRDFLHDCPSSFGVCRRCAGRFEPVLLSPVLTPLPRNWFEPTPFELTTTLTIFDASILSTTLLRQRIAVPFSFPDPIAVKHVLCGHSLTRVCPMLLLDHVLSASLAFAVH